MAASTVVPFTRPVAAPEELPRNVFDLDWPGLLARFQTHGTAKGREFAMNVMRLDLEPAQISQRVYRSEGGTDRITTPLLAKWTNGTVDAVLHAIKSSLPGGSTAPVAVAFDSLFRRDRVTVGHRGCNRWMFIEARRLSDKTCLLPARVRAYLYSKANLNEQTPTPAVLEAWMKGGEGSR